MVATLPRHLHPDAVPAEVLSVLRRLGEGGHRSWLVGGVVRDLLLARERHDPGEFDVATPATPEEVSRLFPRVIPTGIEHGTVTVLEGEARVEVTTFRGESDYLDGRRPSRVTFHSDLEADLARRDFAMNAMAWDPLAGELRDPFGGQADLASRTIRAVGDARERFAEDGLRPIRAVRFVSQLGFALDPATREAIPGALPVVAQVSRERVAEELSRLLVGPHAEDGLRALEATGLLPQVVPGLRRVPEDRIRHALAVASEPFASCASGGGDRDRCRVLRLAGLLHVLPRDEARRSAAEMRLPNRVAVAVNVLAGDRCGLDGGLPPGLEGEEGAAVRRLVSAVGREDVLLLLDFWEADARHQGERSPHLESEVAGLRRRVAAELGRNPPLAVAELALDGQAVMAILGTPGGRAVGEALRHLLDVVLEDPSANTTARLSDHLRAWWVARPAARGDSSRD